MLVSVIIPTFNRREYVCQAIDSVLTQTWTDYEIVVVDDGSTDGTASALHTRFGKRIEYVYQSNRGESAARNEAIRRSRGQYLALLDSDDLWMPTKLERQVAMLESRPEMGLVSCHVNVITAEGEPVGAGPMHPEQTSDVVSLESLALASPVHASTIVVRRSCLTQVGGFDENIRYGEDWDLCLRIAAKHPIGFVLEPLVELRTHAGAQSRLLVPKAETERRLADRLKIIERVFASFPAESHVPLGLKSQTLALEYAKAALAHYFYRDCTRGSELLALAVRCAPTIGDSDGLVVEMIHRFAMLVGRVRGDAAAEEFLRDIFDNLPPELSDLRHARRRALGNAHIELAFLYYQRGPHRLVPRHVLAGLYHNPRWFRNRGVLSILLRSLRSTRLDSHRQ